MSGRIHVIGAGLAGLSAALSLTAAGRAVTVYEASPVAGGRCRSYLDRELGIRVDNGNHLLLSGNRDAMRFLETIGADQSLAGPGEPAFPFMDLASGARWTLRPNRGRLPWWILSRSRRVPGTHAADYLKLLSLPRLTDDRTVAAMLPPGALYERLIEPLAVAALNTRPEVGLARLLGVVVRETLMRGGTACIPCFPRQGLSESLIDPALAWLEARGAQVLFGRRIAALDVAAGRAVSLRTTDGTVPLDPADQVVLAVPAWVAPALLPGLTAPDAFEAIVNVHYRLDRPPSPAGFIGLIGGMAEWVFEKPGHASVTISAANRIIDMKPEIIAQKVWPEVSAALKLAGPMPRWRVLKEKRATFAATAEQDRKRPGPRTVLGNVFLAGDWIATGLPATIEGAIRSGRNTAETLLAT
jgi:squalene-associated FAD-dependent desaturase